MMLGQGGGGQLSLGQPEELGAFVPPLVACARFCWAAAAESAVEICSPGTWFGWATTAEIESGWRPAVLTKVRIE